MHRGTKLTRAAWNDEFCASYCAAINAPGLTDDDRRLLVRDALDRAGEAGVTVYPNAKMRGGCYMDFSVTREEARIIGEAEAEAYDAGHPERLDIPCPRCGKKLIVEFGNYGSYDTHCEDPECIKITYRGI